MGLRCPCKRGLCHSSFVKKRWSVVQKQENDRRAPIVGMASEHLVFLCSYSDEVKKEEEISLDMETFIQSRVYSLYRGNGLLPRGCWTTLTKELTNSICILYGWWRERVLLWLFSCSFATIWKRKKKKSLHLEGTRCI